MLSFITTTEKNSSKKTIEQLKDMLYNKMEKRDLNQIEKLVKESFIPNNIDVSSELEDLKMDILQDLSELEMRLKPKKEPQNVRPVFKWGQTFRRVFIHLKYSHRFDAPGCLDVYKQALTITRGSGEKQEDKDMDEEPDDPEEGDSVFTGSIKGKAEGRDFKFSAECQVADSVFRYILDLKLHREVTDWTIDKGRHLEANRRKCGNVLDYAQEKEKGNMAVDFQQGLRPFCARVQGRSTGELT